MSALVSYRTQAAWLLLPRISFSFIEKSMWEPFIENRSRGPAWLWDKVESWSWFSLLAFSCVQSHKQKVLPQFFCLFLLDGTNIFSLWNMNFLSVSHSSVIPGNIKERRQQNRMLSGHKDAGSFSLSHEIMVSATPLSQDDRHRKQP